jgi:hypothetical protein
MTDSKPKDLAALTVKVHSLLDDLTADERNKVVTAVMTLFGQSVPVAASGGSGSTGSSSAGSGTKFTKSLATYLSKSKRIQTRCCAFSSRPIGCD